MAKLDKIMAKIASNHPDWSQARVQKRAQARLANQQVNKAVRSDSNIPSSDPMAQAAMGLFQNVMDIGGGSSGNLKSVLSMLGGKGDGYSPVGYSPMSYTPVGGVRDIQADAVNTNLGELRNALTENAKYALGQNLGSLDARVAQGGLPGSSRHGIAQANTIADSDRNLQSTLAQADYQAYDADAARRLAAAQANQAGDIATMNANAGLQGQTIGANAGLQGQAIGANAQLRAAAMNDATNRLGIAGNIANNQANIALQRNQMLLNALGNAYDREMGARGMQYDLLNNQQNRALQYNMFGDNLNFQRQNLLYGMANNKNDTMNQGIYNTGNMQGAGAGSLNSWGSLGDLSNLASLIAPILTGRSGGTSFGAGLGRSSAFGMDSGASCCFLFLEAKYGDGTMDEVVRKYRDENMTERNRRGYYKLAEVLVPAMRKSKLIKGLVRLTMVDPLVSYGKYYYGKGKIGKIFTPVKDFWMKVFDYLGQDHEFIRENGEVV